MWFVIITAVILMVISLVVNFYILVYFSSEEDKNAAYFPKALTLLGLTLAELLVLLLPLDVANKNEKVLDMQILWFVFFVTIAALVIVIFPFAIFYYEEEDDQVGAGKQCATALKYTVVSTFIAILIIVLTYAFLNEAQIPILQMQAPLFPAGTVPAAFLTDPAACVDAGVCASANSIMNVPMSFPVYLIGLVAVLGWFFFAIFGGIGMVALPLDLIRAWYFRPRPLDLQQWAREKILLRDRATALIEIGKRIEKEYMGRRDRKYKKVFAKFKTAVYHLENDFSKLRIAYKEKGGSPLKYWSIGLLGFLCAILSFCWFLHIILYMSISPPVSPFLNDLLKASESEFALFGTILYCLFTLHLIMAVIKGNLKFGLRFLFIPIHPMRVGATMMNSFLVNTSLILMSSVACVQFCSRAFASYARLTDAAIIFGAQIQQMKGVRYMFIFFQYAFLGIIGLSAIYFALCPKDLSKEHEIEDDFEALQGRGGTVNTKLQKKRWFG